jgi:hypothetical protein
MTVHHARVVAVAVVLVGISVLFPLEGCTQAQRPLDGPLLDELPVDELRALAEQGYAQAEFNLGEPIRASIPHS